MTKLYLYTYLTLFSIAPVYGQGTVNIEAGNNVITIPANNVDLMQSDTLRQHIHVSYPANNSRITTSDTIAASLVNLSNEKMQPFNVLNCFSFEKSKNLGLIEDITYTMEEGETTALVVIPNANPTTLVPTFQTTGAHIFANGKLWNKGEAIDFTKNVELKVISFNGDVRTYNLKVSKTALPQVEISTTDKKNIDKDWSSANISISGTDEGALNIKGKGSHFAEGLKNNYALKFENKKSLLNITKNKRWLLVANEADKTLLRAQLGYWISGKLSEGQWVPSSKPINLNINGQYAGAYMLLEQPRICKGRIETGFLLSIEQDADDYTDAFRTKLSNTTFVFEDPETGSKGTALIRTKNVIDRFEKALAKEDWATIEQIADLKSIANWLVVNEIAYNTEAFATNTIIHVDENGKISMLPAWELKKAFGCETEDYEGWTASNTPWMKQLLKYDSFLTLVKQQYSKVRKMETEMSQFVELQKEDMKEAALANNVAWKNLHDQTYGNKANAAYENEHSNLVKWLNNRLTWIDTQW